MWTTLIYVVGLIYPHKIYQLIKRINSFS